MATSPTDGASAAPPDDGGTLTLQSDAWLGDAPASGAFDEAASLKWALQPGLPAPKRALRGVDDDFDLRDWRAKDVGWGLIVPDNDDPALSAADKAVGVDLPEPLRKLCAARGDAPIFRWRAQLDAGRLRRYRADGSVADLVLTGVRGIGRDAVPHYLLIAASPAQVPWSVQYRLQLDAFVGRIDLAGDALARYVAALTDGFSGSSRRRSHPVIWAVDHGAQDITRLMRTALAEPLAEKLAAVAGGAFQMQQASLLGDAATRDALLRALATRAPAVVVTSSHGATFPLDDAAALRAVLGVPVDQQRRLLDLAALGLWAPDGCIWYAHACCSAGADGASSFSGLFNATSSLARTLDAIARAGPCIAPLPQALLSAQKPVRAFVGHVEPTFDWTLRDPVTRQVTAQSLIDVFTRGLLSNRGEPLGMALDRHFRTVGGLLFNHIAALGEVNAGVDGANDRARRAKLMAIDRLAMVLIGDPTVSLPATPAAPSAPAAPAAPSQRLGSS
jgi:hypothetical protein